MIMDNAVFTSRIHGRVDLILDLETLGKKPGCVVLQIGAIAFRPGLGLEVIAEFTTNIDIGSSLAAGLTIDPETLVWWQRQSPEAQASVFAKGDTLESAVKRFMLFWQSTGCDEDSRVWVRGADFDPPIWAAAIIAGTRDATDSAVVAPWRYDRVRDIRTALEVMGINRNDIPRDGEAHTALADAAHDLACLNAGSINEPKVRA